MVDQQLRRSGIGNIDIFIKIQQELRCGFVVVWIGVLYVKCNNRHSIGDGSVQFHDHPRPHQDRLGLKQDQYIAALDILEQAAKIIEIIFD